MKRLRGYLDHGFLELDNNTAERSMRGIAIGRKNYMFVGSDRGGKSAAIIYTLIETAKLNGVDPQAWLTDTLSRIADGPQAPHRSALSRAIGTAGDTWENSASTRSCGHQSG